jgi:spectinomycin phosphotransferase
VRTPPEGLDDGQLSRVLARCWNFPVVDLRYAPVGFGSHHWTATGTSGELRFVTVDDHDQHGGGREAGAERLRRAFTSAHLLRRAGLEFVVAPIAAVDGSLLRAAGARFAVSTYPFVEGREWPAGPGSTAEHSRAVVELVARLHAATPAVRDVAGIDDLALPQRADLDDALGALAEPWTGGPFSEPARELLSVRAPDVRRGLTAYDELVVSARQDGGGWVVTHGEPKPDNVLDTSAGPVLVDWDTALTAPPARDLWMVDGDPAEVVGHYAELTGRVVGEAALRTYRLGWALAEVATYTHWLRHPHERTPDTDIAWRGLTGYLDELR